MIGLCTLVVSFQAEHFTPSLATVCLDDMANGVHVHVRTQVPVAHELLHEFERLLSCLRVNEDKMETNLLLNGDKLCTERVMMVLAKATAQDMQQATQDSHASNGVSETKDFIFILLVGVRVDRACSGVGAFAVVERMLWNT